MIFKTYIRAALCPIFALVLMTSSFAQEKGEIVVYKDVRMIELLEKHKEISKYEGTIDGFRVQFFFDAGNQSQFNANQARTIFLNRYRNIDVYIVFESPYYKVRAGDFRTRLEAEHFLNLIRDSYPNAFIVRDKINYPPLH